MLKLGEKLGMWLSQWGYLDACPLISGVVTLPRSLASFGGCIRC
jgi:hypothetical protein